VRSAVKSQISLYLIYFSKDFGIINQGLADLTVAIYIACYETKKAYSVFEKKGENFKLYIQSRLLYRYYFMKKNYLIDIYQ